MKTILSFLTLLLLSNAALVSAQAPSSQLPDSTSSGPLSAEQLREDLRYLRERLQTLHPDLLRRAGRENFERDAAALEAQMPSLSSSQALVGMMRLVASIRDGHTLVPSAQPRAGFTVLPLRFYLHGDELYLAAADRRYSAALGAKLEAIGGVPVAEVLRRVRSVTSGDNAMSVDSRVPSYLVVPEVLAGLGVIENSRVPVALTLRRDGRRIPLSIAPVPAPDQMMSMNPIRASYSNDWVDTLPASPPIWLRQPLRPYWFEHDPATGTMFVQYNQSTSDPSDPMPAFARRLRAAIAEQQPARVVLDLRLNSGGNGFWNRSLLLALLRADNIEARGKLFVLIGRQNFSAGMLMAIELEKYSNAIFIGEPTGGALQNYGDHEPITLPNSGLLVMISTGFYQNNGPGDDRTWLAPQIAAELSPSDYALGRDAALTAVLTYRPPVDVLRELLLAHPPVDAAAAFRRFKSMPAYRYLNSEPVLTGIGYEFIRANEFQRAVATMQVAVDEHPQAANAYDSLGDAYRAAGDRDAAIVSYRRALEISPGWQSARESLRALGVELASPAH